VNFARAVQAREFIVKDARQSHPAIGLDVLLTGRGDISGRATAHHRMNHAIWMLPVLLPSRNRFFAIQLANCFQTQVALSVNRHGR
jgi:hypothetical protein